MSPPDEVTVGELFRAIEAMREEAREFRTETREGLKRVHDRIGRETVLRAEYDVTIGDHERRIGDTERSYGRVVKILVAVVLAPLTTAVVAAIVTANSAPTP